METPAGIFSALSAGSFHTCGLRPSGDVECWPSWGVEGNLDDNLTFRAQPVVPALAQNAPAARFTTLQNPAPIETRSGEPLVPDTGTHHACDAGLADRAACQQSPDGDRDHPWTPVTSPEPQPKVWRDSRVVPLPGPFVSLASGWQHTCGIRPDNTVDCWSAYEPRNRPLGG